jgi:thioredoxin reductase
MTQTVDLVIAGDGSAARAAAVGALERGRRVLVVVRSGGAQRARRLRRDLRDTTGAGPGQLEVMADAEVVCVDGVGRVEAVVVRHSPTGRVSAVNASAYLAFDPSS